MSPHGPLCFVPGCCIPRPCSIARLGSPKTIPSACLCHIGSYCPHIVSSSKGNPENETAWRKYNLDRGFPL